MPPIYSECERREQGADTFATMVATRRARNLPPLDALLIPRNEAASSFALHAYGTPPQHQYERAASKIGISMGAQLQLDALKRENRELAAAKHRLENELGATQTQLNYATASATTVGGGSSRGGTLWEATLKRVLNDQAELAVRALTLSGRHRNHSHSSSSGRSARQENADGDEQTEDNVPVGHDQPRQDEKYGEAVGTTRKVERKPCDDEHEQPEQVQEVPHLPFRVSLDPDPSLALLRYLPAAQHECRLCGTLATDSRSSLRILFLLEQQRDSKRLLESEIFLLSDKLARAGETIEKLRRQLLTVAGEEKILLEQKSMELEQLRAQFLRSMEALEERLRDEHLAHLKTELKKSEEQFAAEREDWQTEKEHLQDGWDAERQALEAKIAAMLSDHSDAEQNIRQECQLEREKIRAERDALEEENQRREKQRDEWRREKEEAWAREKADLEKACEEQTKKAENFNKQLKAMREKGSKGDAKRAEETANLAREMGL